MPAVKGLLRWVELHWEDGEEALMFVCSSVLKKKSLLLLFQGRREKSKSKCRPKHTHTVNTRTHSQSWSRRRIDEIYGLKKKVYYNIYK